MTYKEYEQKKQECWEEYVSKHGMKNAIPEEPFSFTFDRAYALGKENETITQEEIEKAAKEYAAKVDKNVRDLYGIENSPTSLTFGECAAESFREGVKFALGKQERDGIDLKKLDKMLDNALKKETKESLNQWLSEKDTDTVIQGWVAIDEAYGQCFLHTEKPIQKAQPIADTGDYDTVWDSNGKTYLIDVGLFPDMDSDSDPIEVELIIKRKKK